MSTEHQENPVELLRVRLHASVDEAINELRADRLLVELLGVAGDIRADHAAVTRIRDLPPFDYRWPEIVEGFDEATLYLVEVGAGQTEVVVAWTDREAWGRRRRRGVVFDCVRRIDEPMRWYPWTEFVETDEGNYAAIIPAPSRPRAALRDGDALPTRYVGADVRRADELFVSIRNGPSLRLVVDGDDEPEMVRHGYWVARQRRRV